MIRKDSLKGIKNLIFDLGGVIIDLSQDSTVREFAKLGGVTEEKVRQDLLPTESFHDYERGAISDDEFRDRVRHHLGVNASNDEIDRCWNAMLAGLPIERLQLLERLRKNYRLYLLSNTCEIHLIKFNQMVFDMTGHEELDYYFDKAYYSHRIKMRKPGREIYDSVLADSELHAEQTLFLDDNLINLEGAEVCGIKTFHVKNPELVLDLFS